MTTDITEEQAHAMFTSNIPLLISIAESTYPNLFKKQVEWENFGIVRGYYTNTNSNINSNIEKANSDNKNTYPTQAEAEASLALSQLCQWRDKYNSGWKPDWTSYIKIYVIYFINDGIETDWVINRQCVLAFRTEEIRDKFLKDFEDLIETAKPLI